LVERDFAISWANEHIADTIKIHMFASWFR